MQGLLPFFLFRSQHTLVQNQPVVFPADALGGVEGFFQEIDPVRRLQE